MDGPSQQDHFPMKLCASLFLLLAVSFCASCDGRVYSKPLNRVKLSESIKIAAVGKGKASMSYDSIEAKTSDSKVLNGNSKAAGSKHGGECSIAIRELINPTPVFLKTNSSEFYPYNDVGVIVVNASETFQLWCPDKFKNFKTTLLTATCINGTTFRADGNTRSLKELACNAWPNYDTQKTGEKCNGGVMVRVGFSISPKRFVQQMEVCFNEEEEVTRYVHYSMNSASNDFQKDVDRLTFRSDGFFNGKNVDKLYTQAQHQTTISKELGFKADKYFDPKKNVFLARGHMGAKADFVYGTEQRATFTFINVAPQWQSFNAGNWQRIEDSLRVWVSKYKKSVECYTGVWGVTTLPNSRGVETPLYLTYDRNHNGLIPVPKLYFRVVVEPATNKGIVFVGVNNPHLSLEQIKKDYMLCNDVSDKVNFINWKRTDLTEGYSYACTVDEFVQKVEHLPEFNATGGLLI